MRYLDPKNDLTFKKIFCEHPDILMDLLNSLLDFKKGRHIKQLEYLPAELPPLNPFLKNSIVDVRCTDNYERQFIVEMQMLWTDSFTSRVLFNASKAFVKQLDKGIHYSRLRPVYSVNLVNEIFLPRKNSYYHDYKIVNVEDKQLVLEGLSFLFVELPKINEFNLPKSINRALWLRFFTEIKDKTEKISEALTQNPKIKEALDILQESAFTQEELEQYDKHWDNVSTERSIREDSLVKGREMGRQEMMKKIDEERQAAAQRIDEERQAAVAEKRAAAKMLFLSGVAKETIAACYQISLSEVEKWLS
jgi:predicted transposase/invertase (TIGR01784 family)